MLVFFTESLHMFCRHVYTHVLDIHRQLKSWHHHGLTSNWQLDYPSRQQQQPLLLHGSMPHLSGAPAAAPLSLHSAAFRAAAPAVKLAGAAVGPHLPAAVQQKQRKRGVKPQRASALQHESILRQLLCFSQKLLQAALDTCMLCQGQRDA